MAILTFAALIPLVTRCGGTIFPVMRLRIAAVSAVVGYLMARNANKVFGMVNGDILGATNEVSRPVVMVSMLLPFICWL